MQSLAALVKLRNFFAHGKPDRFAVGLGEERDGWTMKKLHGRLASLGLALPQSNGDEKPLLSLLKGPELAEWGLETSDRVLEALTEILKDDPRFLGLSLDFLAHTGPAALLLDSAHRGQHTQA